MIRETATLLERSIDKRISIKLGLEAKQATLLGDPSQVQNALLNLALNARDAMPEGGTLEIATKVLTTDRSPSGVVIAGNASGGNGRGASLPQRTLCVTIADTGCGMPAAVKKRIFEPFFTTKPIGKGTGMGLASVFGTVGMLHGTISVESEIGKGTLFRIQLPLSESQPESDGVAEAAPSTAKLRILVVDDEKMLADMLAAILKTEGHAVHEENSGQAALAHYQENWNQIDLVILDMIMPGWSGLETLEKIRAVNPAAKVILTSGFRPDGAQPWDGELGAMGFLGKPFSRAHLAKVIAGVFDSSGETGGGNQAGNSAGIPNTQYGIHLPDQFG